MVLRRLRASSGWTTTRSGSGSLGRGTSHSVCWPTPLSAYYAPKRFENGELPRTFSAGSAPPFVFAVVSEATPRASGTFVVLLAQETPATSQTLPLPKALRAPPGR